MKRSILFLCLVPITVAVHAQYKAAIVADNLKNIQVKAPKMVPVPGGTVFYNPMIGEKVQNDIIGTTFYDLQSYNALQNRLYAWPDGTIGATYMRANDIGTWNERGTAYNFYDGTAWGPLPTGRIETMRTGWPCYAPYGPTGEIVVSHSVIQTTGLVFNKRSIRGQGEWEEFYLQGPEGYDIVWPAMITNGPDNLYIHVLALSYGTPYENMTNALLYYRSLDGGQTWDINGALLPEINSDYFNTIDGDGYSWAAPHGETIAFSVGFKIQDGYVMKSYDNGTTWEKIMVFDSPLTPYPGGETPAIPSGDATQGIALDSQDRAHVVFGRMLQYYDPAGTLYFYPSTEGLIYWNETMPPLDTTAISSYTLDYLIQGGNLVGWIEPYQGDSTVIGYGTYYVSLTSHPQITIDGEDNVYVVYAAVSPGFDNGTLNYRHIWGNGSNDAGTTWFGPKDYTNSVYYWFSESMYPAISPTIEGNNVHLIFQTDPIPGIHIWTAEHDPVENSIVYIPIPAENFLVGVDEPVPVENDRVEVITYPNPFREQLIIEANCGKSITGKVGLKLFDATGKLVYQEEAVNQSDGNIIFRLNGVGLPVGIYGYSVGFDGGSASGKVLKY